MSAFGSRRLERPVVIGFGALPVGRYPGRTPTDLSLEALHAALDFIGLNPAELEGVYTVPVGYTRAEPPCRPQRIAERLGIEMRALVEVEHGGTSSILAFKAACEDVALGHLEVAAVVAGQAERRKLGAEMDAADRDRMFLLNAMYGSYLGPYGLVGAMPLYALAAQRYMHDHDLTPEAIAELPVLLRRNAARNELAEFREPLEISEVLHSRMVSPPIHKLEAAPWSDGAAAVIVVGAGRARRLCLEGAAVTGWGECHDGSNYVPYGKDLTRYPWIGSATEQALDRCGRTLGDLDLVEIYGAFAHAELMTYEAMGFFGPGEAAAAVARGETAPDGQIPINAGGGRLSLGHPPQATPLYMIGELFEQLTGRARDRQIRGASIGAVQAEHGMMNGAGVAVLETDA